MLNELKVNIIEDIKDYIEDDFETENINEIKKECKSYLKTESNIKKKSNETNNKTTRIGYLCKIEKNRDCFYKTGGFCKGCCSQKISCSICNNVLNRSSPNKHRKKNIITNHSFLTMLKHKIPDYRRLNEIT